MSESLLEELAVAIERNHVHHVELLIRSSSISIDVNARLPRALNPPPLVLAADGPLYHRVGVVAELLLNAGARIDDADDDGQTACHLAVLRGHGDALPVLL